MGQAGEHPETGPMGQAGKRPETGPTEQAGKRPEARPTEHRPGARCVRFFVARGVRPDLPPPAPYRLFRFV